MAETFIIIQNCKMSLLQQLTPINNVKPTISFLSRSQFSQIKKDQIKNTVLHLPDHNYLTQETTTTALPTTIKATNSPLYKLTPKTTTSPNRPLNIPPPSRSTYLTPDIVINTNYPQRTKRHVQPKTRRKKDLGVDFGVEFSA